MSLPVILDVLQSDKNQDLYIAVLNEDLEIVFSLPPIKQVEQYKKLILTAGDTSFKTIIIEHIFKKVVKDSWIVDNGDIQAGIPHTIVNLVFRMSGMDDDFIPVTNSLLDEYRAKNESPLEKMKRTICSTFSGYTFEKCDKLSYPKLIELFVHAEKIELDNNIISSEYTFETEEDKKQKAVKSLHQQIKADQMAYQSFNKPEMPNVMMEEIRKQQIEKARQEEIKYRKSLTGE
jgi:hypothetical protein